ncbi:hypothetical protein [Pontibacter roseus]|uniref:hypothetical protein n=1 Tax=Pontibacter roseus TaxID=336989 RepID=UPI000375B3AD|nr:hypothetical protein [Pontibacter roseus]
MRTNMLYLCLLLGTVAGASCSQQKTGQETSTPQQEPHTKIATHFNPDWAMDKLWEDGLAEVAIYEVERVIYKKKRNFEYTLITVKEDFNQEHNVKTDDYTRADLFPVMKVNEFCRIPTEEYPYHFLTSLFIRRENPLYLHKLTTSSQEWCGNTFKALTDQGNSYNLYYNSYFDGEGEGNRELPKELLLEDQLPYTLRSLRFRDGLRFEVPVLETQQTNKLGKLTVYKATVSVAKAAIDGNEAWEVQVQLAEGKENRYWFASVYPNQLLRQQTWDGRNLELKQLSRYAYWQTE